MQKVLVNKNNPDFRIDEVLYRQIVTYLRYMHFISEKVEYDVGNNMAKKFLIDRMRRKQKKLLRDYGEYGYVIIIIYCSSNNYIYCIF